MADKQHLGVTPPISTSMPTDVEKQSNEALLVELRDQGTFESPLETRIREEVLAHLEEIVNKFVAKVAQKQQDTNPVLVRNARGRIFTYGSYRLGVFGPGSDIDTICICPRYVTISDFFELLPDLLVEMTTPGEVKDIKPVPTAFVPIIKFEYRDISIDLIFSSIKSLQQLPANKDWSLQDVNLLRGMDDAMVASLNGPRVTDDVLRAVPEQTTFKLALRAIKLWAKRRALYGAIYGYPGGVAWAIAVARVCQLYPRATSSVIVNRFFRIFTQWPWPQPVLLKQMEEHPLGLRTWNPKIYHGDKRHIMPIITPTYPSFCTTHNVTKSAMDVIQQELAFGRELTDQMVLGKRPWKELFAKHNFFTGGFKYYLTITSISRTKESHKPWSGFIESRSRHLAMDVENHSAVVLARPYVKAFDRVHRCKTEAEVEEVANGSLAYVVKEDELPPDEEPSEANNNAVKHEITADEARIEETTPATTTTTTSTTPPATSAAASSESNGTDSTEHKDKEETEAASTLKNGAGEEQANGVKAEPPKANAAPATKPKDMLIYTTTQFIGLTLGDGVRQIDLSGQCNKFTKDCTLPEKYDVTLTSLRIQHIRAFNLPDDVFEPGEMKPPKPIKKKRSATDDHNPAPAKRQQTAAAPAG